MTRHIDMGDVLVGKTNVLGLVFSSLATLLLSVIIIFITEKLLHSERYTVSIESVDAREVKRRLEGGKASPKEVINKIHDDLSFLINEAFYPFVVLSASL